MKLNLFFLLFFTLASTISLGAVSANPPGPVPLSGPYQPCQDDGHLAPPSLLSTVQRPNLKVFNVKLAPYNAIGDGKADDTLAIRHAIQDAEAAKGGIICLPTGTYAVQRQPGDAPLSSYGFPSQWNGNSSYTIPAANIGPIFTISSSNIVIQGDGAANTHIKGHFPSVPYPNPDPKKPNTFLWTPGLQDPTTNWFVTNDPTHYFKVGRFEMFVITPPWKINSSIEGVQFRSVDIDGGAGFSDVTRWAGGDPIYGTGWDMTHKGIFVMAGWNNNTVDKTLIYNSTVRNFRGEIVFYLDPAYVNNDLVKKIPVQNNIIMSQLSSSNADAISGGASLLVANSVLGGPTLGTDDVLNGIEPFQYPGTKLTIQDSVIEPSSDPKNPHGIGVVVLGMEGSSFTIERNQFIQNYFGLSIQEFAHNISVKNNTFTSTTFGLETVQLCQYCKIKDSKGNMIYPLGFNNIYIYGNTFDSTQAAFYNMAPAISNLVIAVNTIPNGGALLGGTINGLPTSWPGFMVARNTIGSLSVDANYNGTAAALWDRNNRPSGFANTHHYIPAASGTTIATGRFYTDQTFFGWSKTQQSFELDVTSLPYYPAGFYTTLFATQSNWVIKADPNWNTFPGDISIGPTKAPITIFRNAQGLFQLGRPAN